MDDHYLKFWILVNGVPTATGLREWSRWMEHGKERVIVQTKIDHETWVSTVFLGLDHSFGSDPTAPPILYETMIFGGPHNQESRRYATHDEAVAGHAAMVERAMAGE